MSKGSKGKPRQREANDEAEMKFEDIARRLGISRQAVCQTYKRAIRKLRTAAAFDAFVELSEYHHQLRAKSAECLADREHW